MLLPGSRASHHTGADVAPAGVSRFGGVVHITSQEESITLMLTKIILLVCAVSTAAVLPAEAGQAGQRRHFDSVLNGALIGAGAGVATGLFMCHLTEPWAICRND